MSSTSAAAKAQKRTLFSKKKEPAMVPAHRKPLKTRLKENWQLYLLLLYGQVQPGPRGRGYLVVH